MTSLEDKDISVIDWLAKPPDLTLIMSGSCLIRGREHPSDNVLSLSSVLVKDWKDVPQNNIVWIIRRVPHHCQEWANTRGGGTWVVRKHLWWKKSNFANIWLGAQVVFTVCFVHIFAWLFLKGQIVFPYFLDTVSNWTMQPHIMLFWSYHLAIKTLF